MSKLEKRAVVAFVVHQGLLLMGRKRKDSPSRLAGKWHIPGETLKKGEIDYDALVRGVQEEAGIEVQPREFLGSHTTYKGELVNWYWCDALSNQVIAGSDLDAVKWVTTAQALEMLGPEVLSRFPRQVLDFLAGSNEPEAT